MFDTQIKSAVTYHPWCVALFGVWIMAFAVMGAVYAIRTTGINPLDPLYFTAQLIWIALLSIDPVGAAEQLTAAYSPEMPHLLNVLALSMIVFWVGSRIFAAGRRRL